MRLFRKKTSSEEAAPPEAAAPEALEEASPSQADGQADKPKPRRRRGTRGGRGRGKKKVEAAEGGAKTESKAAAKAEPKPRQPRQKKKDGEDAKPRRRRTQTPKRSALPKVKKEIFVSVEVTEQRVAVLEDGVVVEVYLGRASHSSVAGNVYKGIVDNVLPGMEASFVEIGLEKNGFLYVDEIVVPELEGKPRHGRRIQELIERGQEVLVQAVKDPMGTKGARLTTEISLPGRFLVFVPYGDGIGVSRRLEDEERERLKVDLQGSRASRRRAHRPHGGRGRLEGRARGRPRSPAEALVDHPGARQARRGSVARLPGVGAAAPDHPRPLHPRLRARGHRPRPHVPAHRRLPQADLARARGARRALQGQGAAYGAVRRGRRPCARRSTGASTFPPAVI